MSFSGCLPVVAIDVAAPLSWLLVGMGGSMNIGDTFDLSIHEKHLDTGVHEYIVWFDATCEVIPESSPPCVEIVVDCDMPRFATEPHRKGPSSNPILADVMPYKQTDDARDDADPASMLDRALDGIRKGVEYALLHRRHGLRVRIREFKLHPIDFQPSRFFLHTYYYTRRQLELGKQQ